MEYVQMTLNDWMSLKKEIAEEFARASASFVRIGYLLRKAEDSEGYKNDGYDSLAEWAKAELGLTATYVSRFKSINAKYSVDGYSDRLRTEFVGYGSAKLGEMLSLPDADMEMIKPDTKRDDIRALKEFNREAPQAESGDSWISDMIRILPDDVVNALAKAQENGELTGKTCGKIINPGGNSMKRTKAAMIALSDDGLLVKMIGPDGMKREKLTWQEFADRLPEIAPRNPIPTKTEEPEAKAQEICTEPEENAQSETENVTSAPETEQPDQEQEPIAKEPKSAVDELKKVLQKAEGEIMPEPVTMTKPEPVKQESEEEKPPIAPAQKPQESQAVRDFRDMKNGFEKAVDEENWDRALMLAEGMSAALRKILREQEGIA